MDVVVVSPALTGGALTEDVVVDELDDDALELVTVEVAMTRDTV